MTDITVDDNQRVRLLDSDSHDEAQKLRSECSQFVQSALRWR